MVAISEVTVTPVEAKLRSPSRGLSKLEGEAHIPQRGRSSRGARARLHFEETQETWDSASSHKQERKRASQLQEDCELIKAASPVRRPASPVDRHKQRSLSLGSPRARGDTHIAVSSEWLEDLRQTLGRPIAGDSTASSPVAAGKGGRRSDLSLPADAAVLAAALAARLRAGQSQSAQPRRATADTSHSSPSRRSSSTPPLPPRWASADSQPSASRLPRYSGRATSASSSSCAVPSVGSRQSVAPVPATSSGGGHNTAENYTASSMVAAGGRRSSGAGDLTMLEKAVVVGAGLALYPAVAAYNYVRSPQNSPPMEHRPSGFSAAALEEAGADHELDLHEPVANLSHSGRLAHSETAISAAGSAEGSAAMSPQANATGNDAAAEVQRDADDAPAVDVPEPTSNSSPDAHARPPMTASAAAAAPVSAEHAAAAAAAARAYTVPTAAVAPAAGTGAGGSSAAAAAAARVSAGGPTTTAPAGASTVIPLPVLSPSQPSSTIIVPAGFSLNAPSQQPLQPAEPAALRSSGASLRAMYGSVPTAASAGFSDAAAFDAAIAAAMAELKATGSLTNPLASMPPIPEASLDGGVATPSSISAVHNNPLYGDAASPRGPKAAAAAAKQQLLFTPETPKQAGLKRRTPRAHSPTNGAPAPPSAARRSNGSRFAALVATLAVISVCGLGMLACVDPSSGHLSGAIGAARVRHVCGSASHEAAQLGSVAAWALHAAARKFGAAAGKLPAQAADAAAAAVAALRQAPGTALDRLWLAGSCGYRDLQLVAQQASRVGSSAVAAVLGAAAEAGSTIRGPATWALGHHRGIGAAATGALHKWSADCKGAASVAVVALSDEWHAISVAIERISRYVPTSAGEVYNGLAAVGTAIQSTAAASARGASSAGHRSVAAVGDALGHLALVTLPPEVRPVAQRAGLWARISSRSSTTASNPSAAAKPSPEPAAAAEPSAAAKPKLQPVPLTASKPAAKTNIAHSPPPAARPAAAFPAARKQGVVPKAVTAASKPAASATGAAMTSGGASNAVPRATVPAAPRSSAVDAAAAVLATSAAAVPITKPQLPAAASAVAASPLVVGVLVALAVCAMAAAVAHYLGWFAGATAHTEAHDSSAAYEDDDVPMPDEGGVDEALFDAAFGDAAPRPAANRRRHTIAAPQGREFTWLRPNEVVTRAAAVSAAGLDYLWLRSRLVIKLSPEARNRVAKSSDLAGLGRDTSFRSPMAALRNIHFEPRRRSPTREAAAAPPLTTPFAAAARRRRTLG